MSSTGWLADESDPLWIGLDIGGANLKVADGRGRARSEPFELWKRPDDLANAIQALLERSVDTHAIEGVALSMTGELADCYPTKAEGVRAIVAATRTAVGSLAVRVATTDDRWFDPHEAEAEPKLAAAANWRVAARLIASAVEGHGTWIDVGSTTTDLVPFGGGQVRAAGATDTERLLAGELLYTGVRRTPVCGLVDRLPYRGHECPVMAEWFATSADAWLVLGELAEDLTNTVTADGRPLSRSSSIDRLARCVGADREAFDLSDAQVAAGAIAMAQQSRLAEAIVVRPGGHVVLSGEGAFLANRAIKAYSPRPKIDRLGELAGEAIANHLPAHAAAVLAARELGSVA